MNSNTRKRITPTLVLSGAVVLVTLAVCSPAMADAGRKNRRSHTAHSAQYRQHHGQKFDRHGRSHKPGHAHKTHRGYRPQVRLHHPPPPHNRHPLRLHGPYARHSSVPAFISYGSSNRYKRFYRERVHHAPHGHDHLIYDFPVATHRGVVWRSHHYCEGRLHGSGFSIEGPRFGLHVSF